MKRHIQRDLSRESRMKRSIRRNLAELLDLVNSVPAGIELPELTNHNEEVTALLNSDAFEEYRRLSAALRIKKLRGSFNQEFRHYNYVRGAREWLKHVVVYGKVFRHGQPHKCHMPPLPQANLLMEVNQRREMQFSGHPIIDALTGVKILTIRCCAVCRKFFVARRKDQPCCTPQCAHIRRTRLWRAKYPDKYKQNRIAKSNRN
jgi:hypothetical protein